MHLDTLPLNISSIPSTSSLHGKSSCLPVALCSCHLPGLLHHAPLLQLFLLPLLALTGRTEVAKAARETVLATLRMQKSTRPATTLCVCDRTNAGPLECAKGRAHGRRRHRSGCRHPKPRCPSRLRLRRRHPSLRHAEGLLRTAAAHKA